MGFCKDGVHDCHDGAMIMRICRLMWALIESKKSRCMFDKVFEGENYTLVISHGSGKSPFCTGKFTISMVTFNNCVCLPQGAPFSGCKMAWGCQTWTWCTTASISLVNDHVTIQKNSRLRTVCTNESMIRYFGHVLDMGMICMLLPHRSDREWIRICAFQLDKDHAARYCSLVWQWGVVQPCLNHLGLGHTRMYITREK